MPVNQGADGSGENRELYGPPTDLTAFQRDLLAQIAILERNTEQPHGLQIKSALEPYYNEVHHGRLYPNLDTLVNMGLVKKGEKDRRTNYYTVTRRGRRELEEYEQWIGAAVSEG